MIVDHQVIVSIFSDGDDLSDWVGATYDEAAAELAHRQILVYDREKVDQWMSVSLERTHYFDQIQFLRTEAKPKSMSRGGFHLKPGQMQRHFLLRAIETWWSKVFPSNYGIYVRLDGNSANAILLTVKRGRIDSFNIPDLSSMIPERRRVSADVVKYLSERHLIPIQGLFLTSTEWAEWSEMDNPWPMILKAGRSDGSKFAPSRWGLISLVAGRAYLGL